MPLRLLAAIATLALVAPSAHAFPPDDPCRGLASATHHKASGKGTAHKPYRICTPAQLASLGASPSSRGLRLRGLGCRQR